MNQLNRESKNLPTRYSHDQMQDSHIRSHKHYCPGDDELKTARRLLRPRG